ncbi:MAG: glycosyltransferase [Terriglobia bacterium]
MRILHVPYSYYPDPAGGTEIYVHALANWQRTFGCEVAVAAPEKSDRRYDHDGVDVWRFGVAANPALGELYGEGDKTAAAGFAKILDECRPDILHLHAFTGAVSVLLAEEAERRSIPVFFNYHTPTVSCARGTLLRWGSEICDGDLKNNPCAACTLNGYGVSRTAASMVSWLPLAASRKLGDMGLSGGIWTAARMPELVDTRIRAFHRLMRISRRVFALCEWTKSLLTRNGVPAEKITLCRQGISWQPLPPRADRDHGLPLRVAFLGRFDPTKGTHLLVQALRQNRDLPIRLDLYGVRQLEGGDRYAALIQTAMGDDSRIRLLPPIPGNEVVPLLRGYELLAVPSQWLETGPLVVLEAFAAGTPVLGSDLGGIAELVRDGVDGVLVKHRDSAAAWAEALSMLCANPDMLTSLRAGIRTPRHTRDVALEMIPLYEMAAGSRKTTVCQ